jgi:hypothetical protein
MEKESYITYEGARLRLVDMCIRDKMDEISCLRELEYMLDDNSRPFWLDKLDILNRKLDYFVKVKSCMIDMKTCDLYVCKRCGNFGVWKRI